MTRKEIDVLFSLSWIGTHFDNENQALSYFVVLQMREVKEDFITPYVCFDFTSLDMMFLYLKNLARSANLFSIDMLSRGNYPGKLLVEERVGLPYTFKGFFVNDNVPWPIKNYNAYFMIDTV